jgi:hypothetical protein
MLVTNIPGMMPCAQHGTVLNGAAAVALSMKTQAVVFMFIPSNRQILSVAAYTGQVYHLAEPGALSEAVRPLKPDGSVDADVMGRLSVRHDDSMQNVANRLALWDRQVSASGSKHERTACSV